MARGPRGEKRPDDPAAAAVLAVRIAMGETAESLDVVRALPKEEMANMAQAIVEITALRRKVDSPLETVGGPIDVVIISKGDGLVWAERKHYFDLAKNRDFLYRKESLLRGS